MSSGAALVPIPIFTEGYFADPFPVYRRFLADGPIHFVAMGQGIHAVFSYELISSVLRDDRFTSKRSGAFTLSLPEEERSKLGPLVKMLALWLLFMDPPEHSRLRKLLNKGFSPRAAEALKPRIDALVDTMLDEIGDRAEWELMGELAHPFPARVIAELMGVPESMYADLIGWSDAIATFIGNSRRTIEQCLAAQDAVIGLTAFFRQAVAERRGKEGTDLISLLLEIEQDGEVLTEEELYAQCVMLLFAGHETTRNLIGNGIFTLLQHPQECARLRESPGLIRSAVEELLRYQSPLQLITRVAKQDLTLEGVTVEAGKPIAVMLGSGNRDPKQFNDPDVLNLSRTNNAHLAFGTGAHFCIGNQIARLEGQAAILKTIQRFPKMRFAEKAPEWGPNPAFRGLLSLPVCLR